MSLEEPTEAEAGALVALIVTSGLFLAFVRPELKRVERVEVEMQFIRRHPPRWIQFCRNLIQSYLHDS